MNNDFAMTYWVPDKDWLDPDLRERLEEYRRYTEDSDSDISIDGEDRMEL